jgi:DNA processing protein
MRGVEGRPPWGASGLGERAALLSLAATPGLMPAAVAARLAEGADPVSLLRPHSPEPGSVAARLDALGLRFLVPGDDDWPLAATPPDPPCAWLFVAGPAPPGAAGSVAVVGGRRASPLRRAAARSIGAGLARAGWCVVSGGAVGVDAAAHAGALDAGGQTVVVLGCGQDVSYPRANTGLFARVREAGGSLASEHPPATQPRAAHFLPRNRLIAALSAAVVIVEAAEDSGSLSTARAAGSRGLGHVLVLPGAPWDPGAAGCNQLIRDGATLVRSLTDILEELGATTTTGPTSTGPTTAGPTSTGATTGGRPWPGLDPPARAVLTALIDGQLLTPRRLATETALPPGALDTALLDLELAGLIRRTTAGIQAISLPGRSTTPTQRAPPTHAVPGSRRVGGRLRRGHAGRWCAADAPGAGVLACRVLECGGSSGDDDGDDRRPCRRPTGHARERRRPEPAPETSPPDRAWERRRPGPAPGCSRPDRAWERRRPGGAGGGGSSCVGGVRGAPSR